MVGRVVGHCFLALSSIGPKTTRAITMMTSHSPIMGLDTRAFSSSTQWRTMLICCPADSDKSMLIVSCGGGFPVKREFRFTRPDHGRLCRIGIERGLLERGEVRRCRPNAV